MKIVKNAYWSYFFGVILGQTLGFYYAQQQTLTFGYFFTVFGCFMLGWFAVEWAFWPWNFNAEFDIKEKEK